MKKVGEDRLSSRQLPHQLERMITRKGVSWGGKTERDLLTQKGLERGDLTLSSEYFRRLFKIKPTYGGGRSKRLKEEKGVERGKPVLM